MKKLMVVAAVAMAAFGLHAATANWNASICEYASDWSSPVGSVIFTVAGTDYAATFDEAGEAATVITVSGGESLSVTMNTVLDDGKTYTKTLTGYEIPIIAGTPADQTALSGLNADLATAFQTADGTLPSAADAAAAGWTVAPEPTSGLLLLIGVAGLALRRRRA